MTHTINENYNIEYESEGWKKTKNQIKKDFQTLIKSYEKQYAHEPNLYYFLILVCEEMLRQECNNNTQPLYWKRDDIWAFGDIIDAKINNQKHK